MNEVRSACCSIGKPSASRRSPMKKEGAQQHPDHSTQLGRLNRVVGQLEGIKRMISERRYCPEILTQTRAVVSAMKAIELVVLEKHVRQCVSQALFERNPKRTEEKIKELISVIDRF